MKRFTKLTLLLILLLLSSIFSFGFFIESLSYAQSSDDDMIRELEAYQQKQKDFANQVENAREKSKEKVHSVIMQAGDISMNIYATLAAIFLGIPLALFLLKLIYNVTILPLKNSGQYKKQKKNFGGGEAIKINAKAEKYEQKHKYVQAANHYAQIGNFKKAAECFKIGKRKELAAINYEKAGMPKEAALFYEEVGNYEKAIELYEYSDDLKGLAKCYEKCGQNENAAKIFEQAQQYSDAANHYVNSGNLYKAAKMFELAGDIKKSAEIYEQLLASKDTSQHLDLTRVAKVMEKVENFTKAAELYVSLGNIVDAIQVYVSKSKIDEAAQLYKQCSEDIGDKLLNIVSYDNDQVERYAEIFIKSQDFLRAAQVFDNMGSYQKAAKLYEKGSDYYNSGEMYEMGGDNIKAAQMYEKGGAFSKAAELYVTNKDYKRVAVNYEKSGNAFLAGKYYLYTGDYVRVVGLLQTLTPQDQNYLDAICMIAKALYEQGLFDAAYTRLMIYANTMPLNLGNLSQYYDLACIIANLNSKPKAIDLFAKIAAIKPDFKNASIYAKGGEEYNSIIKGSKQVVVNKGFSEENTGLHKPESGEVVVSRIDAMEWLQNIKIFKELSLQEFRLFVSFCRTMQCKSGQVILKEGQHGTAFFIVKSGVVSINIGKAGTLKSVADLGEGEHFGEISLVSGIPTTAQVMAKTDCELLVIPGKKFRSFLTSNDAITLKIYKTIIHVMAERLIQANVSNASI